MERFFVDDYSGRNKLRLFLNIFGVLLLLAAIPLGIYLTRTQQTFKSQASITPIKKPETSIILSSDQKEYKQGQLFLVKVLMRADSDPVDQIETHLSFPSDLVEVVAIKTDLSSLEDLNRPCLGAVGSVSCPKGFYCKARSASESGLESFCIASDQAKQQSVISSWGDRFFDNQTGEVSLEGVSAQGIKTTLEEESKLIAGIIFKAYAKGDVAISINDDSQVIRASDKTNILSSKKALVITLD